MAEEKVFHIPVLLEEVIEMLVPKSNHNFIDCTIGFSGHGQRILKKTSPQGKLLAIDLDNKALEQSRKSLAEYEDRVIFAKDNYANIEKIVKDNNFNLVNGILFDFGISSYQLEDRKRGFSYQKEGRLNMNFSQDDQGESAEDIVNNYSEGDLIDIFRRFGEFNNFQSKKLAGEIIARRKEEVIKTTEDLKNIVLKSIPSKFKQESILSRVFQSIRMKTNQELEGIRRALEGALNILEPGGRVVCISYHSLEDRIVKQYFRQEAKDCICPDDIPECRCSHKARIKLINKKPIVPQAEEISENIRSRSAKMRVAEKI